MGVPKPVGHAGSYLVINPHEEVNFLLDAGEDLARPLFCKNFQCHFAKDDYVIAVYNGREVVVLESKRLPQTLPDGEFDFLGYSVLQKHTDKEFTMN